MTKRKVKLQNRYYMGTLCKIALDGKIEDVKQFDIKELLSAIERSGQKNHNVQLSNCIVKFDNSRYYEKEECYVIRLYHMKDPENFSRLKEGELAKPIDLDYGEEIGEKLSIIYDDRNKILVMPYNQRIFSIKDVQEWMNQLLYTTNQYEYSISFSPIQSVRNILISRKNEIRKIETMIEN